MRSNLALPIEQGFQNRSTRVNCLDRGCPNAARRYRGLNCTEGNQVNRTTPILGSLFWKEYRPNEPTTHRRGLIGEPANMRDGICVRWAGSHKRNTRNHWRRGKQRQWRELKLLRGVQVFAFVRGLLIQAAPLTGYLLETLSDLGKVDRSGNSRPLPALRPHS